MSSFGKSDHQLLVSGFFADCEVVCEDKKWTLHKSILCTRSGYFKAALHGNWPEAKTNKVHITKFTKQQMEWVIKYIYTGQVNFQLFQNSGTLLHTCVQLWVLGDYFLVPSLRDLILDHLKEKVVPRTARIATQQNFSINGPDWLEAGRVIYSTFSVVDRTHALKAVFLSISLEKIFVRREVLNKPEFKQLGQEHPSFGNDCMMKLVADHIGKLQ